MKSNFTSYLLLVVALIALGFFLVKSEKPLEQQQGKSEKQVVLKTITKTLKNGEPVKKYVPEGVQIVIEDKMEPGYTLVPMFTKDRIQLLSHQGQVINTWNIRTKRTRLLENCNIIVVHKRDNEKDAEGNKVRNTTHIVSEYDWDSKLVREFTVKGEVHHDTRIFSDQKIMILNRYYIPRNDPLINYPNIVSNYPGYTLKYDVINIVDYQSGKNIFKWDFLENYKADECSSFGCPVKSERFVRVDKEHIDWTHVNSVSEIPENKWYKAGHLEFKPGNMILTVRNWSAIIILDPETKKIVWEYGGSKQNLFEGGHDAYLVPEGLPGAGNILMFDNGDPRLKLNRHPYKSRVLEINPVTLETIWSFDDDGELFTQSFGSAQRLKNGNTLISQDGAWRVIEVNPAGELLWQYNAGGPTSRAERYPPGYCSRFS